MNVQATRTDWKRYVWQALLACGLLVCGLLCPPLGLALAFLSPLTLCPMATQGDDISAWLLALAPTAGMLMAGLEPLLALLVTLCPCACLLVNGIRCKRGMSFNRLVIGYIAAILLSMLPLLARGAWLMGGDLFGSISDATIAWLDGSAQAGNILYRLVSTGFLNAPRSYEGVGAIQLGSFIFLNPSLQDELLKMLRLRLHELLTTAIPSLMVQTSVIVGLFTALRSEQAGAQTSAGRVAPSFLSLQLPKAYRGYVFFLAITSLLSGFSDNSATQIVQTLTYTAFVTIYRLLGAATLLFLMGHKSPRRRPLHALLATALYLLAPVILFILGVADQFLHLRAVTLYQSKED